METPFTIHFTRGTLKLLNEICTNYDLNETGTIRKAIALFFIAKREQKKGHRLAVLDHQGNFISDIHSF